MAAARRSVKPPKFASARRLGRAVVGGFCRIGWLRGLNLVGNLCLVLLGGQWNVWGDRATVATCPNVALVRVGIGSAWCPIRLLVDLGLRRVWKVTTHKAKVPDSRLRHTIRSRCFAFSLGASIYVTPTAQ
jgi:hypothetical protein